MYRVSVSPSPLEPEPFQLVLTFGVEIGTLGTNTVRRKKRGKKLGIKLINSKSLKIFLINPEKNTEQKQLKNETNKKKTRQKENKN